MMLVVPSNPSHSLQHCTFPANTTRHLKDLLPMVTKETVSPDDSPDPPTAQWWNDIASVPPSDIHEVMASVRSESSNPTGPNESKNAKGEGVLSTIAAMVLMTVMYVARVARFA